MPEQNMLIPKSIDSGENGGSVFKSGQIISYLGRIEQSVLNGVVTTTAPEGWLLCNGNIISKTIYSDLWNAVKHSNDTYPYGSTSTTFTLPNFLNTFLSIGTSPVSGGSNTHNHAANVTVNGVSDTVNTWHRHNQTANNVSGNIIHNHGDGGGYIGVNGSGPTANANKTGTGGAGVGPGAGHQHDGTANVGPVANNVWYHDHAGPSITGSDVNANHSHNFSRTGAGMDSASSHYIPFLAVNFIIKV